MEINRWLSQMADRPRHSRITPGAEVGRTPGPPPGHSDRYAAPRHARRKNSQHCYKAPCRRGGSFELIENRQATIARSSSLFVFLQERGGGGT